MNNETSQVLTSGNLLDFNISGILENADNISAIKKIAMYTGTLDKLRSKKAIYKDITNNAELNNFSGVLQQPNLSVQSSQLDDIIPTPIAPEVNGIPVMTEPIMKENPAVSTPVYNQPQPVEMQAPTTPALENNSFGQNMFQTNTFVPSPSPIMDQPNPVPNYITDANTPTEVMPVQASETFALENTPQVENFKLEDPFVGEIKPVINDVMPSVEQPKVDVNVAVKEMLINVKKEVIDMVNDKFLKLENQITDLIKSNKLDVDAIDSLIEEGTKKIEDAIQPVLPNTQMESLSNPVVQPNAYNYSQNINPSMPYVPGM